MPHRTGWFPTKRDDIIHMADAWSVQMGLHGAAWGIPPERITGFQERLAGIKPLFAEVKSAGRNSVNTEQCRIMFREMELDMQFIKANYFNSPPRTPDELIVLLLSVQSGSWTPILPAAVVPGLSLHNTDGHGMLVKLFTDAVPPGRRSADHFFCKWGLKPAGRWATPEEAAADPRLLTRPPAQAAEPIPPDTSGDWIYMTAGKTAKGDFLWRFLESRGFLRPCNDNTTRLKARGMLK